MKGFISLGSTGNWINIDYVKDHYEIEDGKTVLIDIYNLRWTVPTKVTKGKFKDE